MNSIQCGNRLCKKGSGGNIATFVKSRDHQKYCCQACRVEAWNDRKAGGSRIIELEKEVKQLKEEVKQLKDKYSKLQKEIKRLENEFFVC